MPDAATQILSHLASVEGERRRRASVENLPARVTALKEFQQRRFAHTYADLLTTARYGPASKFFLDELYGPDDFTQRDAQFARVVPALVRLFPREILETVSALVGLHALSERLDTATATHLDSTAIDSHRYIAAWQQAGRAPERQEQIHSTANIAARLDRLTRRPLLRNSLRLMRGPAKAAGLNELQTFLELGFETFRKMNGASEFIADVQFREKTLASALFSAISGEESMRNARDLLPVDDS